MALAALAIPAPSAGQARELWASEDGRSTLELRAFYKLFAAGVRLQPGLHEGTEALAGLFERVRLEQPGVQVPDVIALPGHGASAAQTARGWGRLLIKNRVELSAGWQVDATLASDRGLLGTAGFGGSIPVAGTRVASRRLTDFDPVLAERGEFLVQHNLDLLAVKFILPKGELVVGRQVLSWGTGRFWNPTDLLSPFAPTDVDREVRHGVDAVRFSMALGKTALLDLLWLPQKEGWAQGGVARAQANLKGFDLSFSAAKYLSDVVLGTDAAGDLGPLGVHAEVAYTLPLENLGGPGPVKVGERFVRGVAGVEWRPAEKWVLGGEYYFNGFGATEVADYALKLQQRPRRPRRGVRCGPPLPGSHRGVAGERPAVAAGARRRQPRRSERPAGAGAGALGAAARDRPGRGLHPAGSLSRPRTAAPPDDGRRAGPERRVHAGHFDAGLAQRVRHLAGRPVRAAGRVLLTPDSPEVCTMQQCRT